MRYKISHSTHYSYKKAVKLCHNVAHLTPRTYERQARHAIDIIVEPAPAKVHQWEDAFGNLCSYFAVQDDHRQLTVTATSEVEVFASTPDVSDSVSWEQALFLMRESDDSEALAARKYTLESPYVINNYPELLSYAQPSFVPGRPVLETVHDLMGRIYNEFEYDPNFSTVATPIDEVLAHRKGVCQDFAHLAIGCLRAQGLAARYVSGYLETIPPQGCEKLRGADASHAWFSVYVPNLGWVDFDPTNNQIPIDRHIVTAWGRDYGDVTPLKGVIYGGGTHTIDVSVDVQPISPSIESGDRLP